MLSYRKFLFFGIIFFSFVFVNVLEAKKPISVDGALKKVFGSDIKIVLEEKTLTEIQRQNIEKAAKVKFDFYYDRSFPFFTTLLNGEILGYALENRVIGKWGLIHYMVVLNSEGEIIKVVVFELKERRGKPVSKKRFLKQFKGKTIHNRIKLKKDIDGVTSATISSRAVTKGVRKLIHVFNEFSKRDFL